MKRVRRRYKIYSKRRYRYVHRSFGYSKRQYRPYTRRSLPTPAWTLGHRHQGPLLPTSSRGWAQNNTATFSSSPAKINSLSQNVKNSMDSMMTPNQARSLVGSTRQSATEQMSSPVHRNPFTSPRYLVPTGYKSKIASPPKTRSNLVYNTLGTAAALFGPSIAAKARRDIMRGADILF